jgi:hypothetical protein
LAGAAFWDACLAHRPLVLSSVTQTGINSVSKDRRPGDRGTGPEGELTEAFVPRPPSREGPRTSNAVLGRAAAHGAGLHTMYT